MTSEQRTKRKHQRSLYPTEVEQAVKSQSGKDALHWFIKGYDGMEKIYEKTVKAGVFSPQQIKILLRALVARDLSFDEILGACAKNKTNCITICYRSTRRVPILFILAATVATSLPI